MGRRNPLSRFGFTALAVLALWLVAVGNAFGSTAYFSGERYISLDDVADGLGMDTDRLTADKLQLSSQWTKIVFEKDTRQITLNGTVIHLGFGVARKGSTFYIAEKDYEKTLRALLTPQVFTPPQRLARIVLDPGHGGKDNGGENTALKLKEKNLTLDLAKRLKKVLEARGYKVDLTRDSDDFIELGDRPAIANKLNADLFISLHFNASSAAAVSGLETFALTPEGQASTAGGSESTGYSANKNDPWNTLLGFYIQREMVEQLKSKDRGLKRARFAVLKTLDCPGVLVEGGFVTNGREGANLGWDAYRQRLAESIADGVDAYQKTINRLRANGTQ